MNVSRFCIILALVTACSGTPENRLLNSQSSYLLEYADNPVAWNPWDEETLARAKSEDKPIIVSIGYSACHWCHVMESETFMDPEVARIMNENFICVKVDREELPDVDAEYIRASELLTGTAGWPLNAFTLPDGRAFHTVTYATKDAWVNLLDQIIKTWKEDRTNLEKQAGLLKQNIDQANSNILADNARRLDIPAFLNNTDTWFTSLDMNNGGLKGAPKFPMPALGELMLQHTMLTNDKRSQQWLTTTLNAMINGGMYDHLGGAFARYATDSLWLIPHFEKMLYDNAQLVSLYAHAFKATGNRSYLKVINETLSFIETEMLFPESGFYSSINADSEGEEGKFYKWSGDTIRAVAGNDALKYYKVIDGVLNINQQPPNDIYKEMLLAARHKRVRPSVDQKIITSWNAMMIVGYIDAYTATGNQHYLEVALNTAAYIHSNMVDNNRVLRIMFQGNPGREGFLDDYAWLAKAYIALYQSTFNIEWLNRSKAIADLAINKFKNEKSPMFLYSPNGQVEITDHVIPSSNSVFADVLLSLGEYFQNDEYTRLATSAIETAVAPADLDVVYFANWARLAERVNFSPYQIAIVGDRAVEFAEQLQRSSLPPAILLGGTKENLPLLANKLVANKTMIYVCKNRICKLPVDDLKAALNQIR